MKGADPIQKKIFLFSMGILHVKDVILVVLEDCLK